MRQIPKGRRKEVMMKEKNGKQLFPLTEAQKLHFFSQLQCPKKQLMNIGTSLTIQQSLDFGALREAIYQAYARCESMRLRFTQDEAGNVWQYVVDREERPIEFFDFNGWREEDAVAKMKEWTSTPFEPYDSPLNRVVIIITPDGFQGIYLLVHHMTMDAQSLICFLKDVIEIYCNMKYEGIPYPKEMASYIEQLKKDLEYEAGSKAQQRDREFFHNLIESSEPIFNGLRGRELLEAARKEAGDPNLRTAVNTNGKVDASIQVFSLEADPSRRLLEFCEQNHVSMVTLLMMGMRTYLQKFNDNDEVSIVTTVARRATLKEKRCGGTRIHCFPFQTTVKKSDTFMEGLKIIRDGQNKLFRHANFSPTEYFYHRSQYYKNKPGHTYEPFSLTYQPATLADKGLDRLNGIQYRTAWYSNGVAAQALYLTVMHRAEDNGMNFNFEYQTDVVSYEELEKFYYYLCRIMFRGIEDPNRTVGEIIDWV